MHSYWFAINQSVEFAAYVLADFADADLTVSKDTPMTTKFTSDLTIAQFCVEHCFFDVFHQCITTSVIFSDLCTVQQNIFIIHDFGDPSIRTEV